MTPYRLGHPYIGCGRFTALVEPSLTFWFHGVQVAMFIRDEGKGVLLTDVPEFCTSSQETSESTECVTAFNSAPPSCVRLHFKQIPAACPVFFHINPFTPESDQCQISPAASQEI